MTAVGRSICCLAASLFILLTGCGQGDSGPTDTGYSGSWYRETSTVESSLYLWKDGDRYRVKLARVSRDGKARIDCNWDGVCEEFVDGEKTSDYRFRVWLDDRSGHLMLHCTGEITLPKPLSIDYTHELVLEDGGLALRSYTRESQGQSYTLETAGNRLLRKISDQVPDPPVE